MIFEVSIFSLNARDKEMDNLKPKILPLCLSLAKTSLAKWSKKIHRRRLEDTHSPYSPTPPISYHYPPLSMSSTKTPLKEWSKKIHRNAHKILIPPMLPLPLYLSPLFGEGNDICLNGPSCRWDIIGSQWGAHLLHNT